LRNREASRRHSETRGEIGSLYGADLEAPGSVGDTARAEAARKIVTIGNAENESFGIELGYVYQDSPIICAEPDVEIPGSDRRYIPYCLTQ
jgi:hypothetical protein